jgi:two-component system cell cycle response regulator DivK
MSKNTSPLLIIDDDNRNVFALSLMLKSKGFETVAAHDAMGGLALLQKRPDIKVVLLDMMMPEMDGYELLAEIRKMPDLKSLTVFAVTAQAMTGDREKCLAAGADEYISKPIDVDLLIDKLNRFC